MHRLKGFLVACGLLAGTAAAQASPIAFSGTIDSARLGSGLATSALDLEGLPYRGSIAADAANGFSVTLVLPAFTSDGPGCGQPYSGCAPFSFHNAVTVTDAGTPSSSHAFSQVGDLVTFSVFEAAEGSISGIFDAATGLGHVSADVYVGQAYRADNAAFLRAEMSVSAVPLPGAAPLLGAALLLVGAAGYAARRAVRPAG